MMDVIVFNVEHGQSIFFYPRSQPQYGMFVDCGNTQDFNPVDQVIEWNLIPENAGSRVLGNLVITNYDHDHFSGLPYLMSKVGISTVRLAKNISSQELFNTKPIRTEALEKVCHLKDTYTADATFHLPPYKVATFSLPRTCFPNGECDTNNLSQVVFVEYGGSVICIGGDLEADGWVQMLLQPGFTDWLRRTNVFVAAHHGRENGHAEEIFEHCTPECVILSDKRIVHGTQEGMASAYASRVTGDGVYLANQRSLTPRKVLTTRSDGHIWVCLENTGARIYRNIA
jgi:beta-lactamase superfamily II metal-dependent hydrolase